jgi:hypothetical protein
MWGPRLIRDGDGDPITALEPAWDADKISLPLVAPADLRSTTGLLLGRHIDD